MGKYEKIKVLKPDEVPSIDEPLAGRPAQLQNGNNEAFNIINVIIDIFTLRDSIGYCTFRRYKQELKINDNSKFNYHLFLFLFITLDLIIVILVAVAIALLLILIIFAFARGIGFIDWVSDLLVQLKCLP